MRPRQTISQRSLMQLADSIRKYGVLSPLLVNEQAGVFQLICGERRYRAAKLAGVDEVPCLVISIDPQEAGLLTLAENTQREPLNLIDQAHLVQKLHEQNKCTMIEIGESTGLPINEIELLLDIINLPEKIRRSYLNGDIDDQQLMHLAEVKDPIALDARFKTMIA